jgi:DNA-binding transcriptional MerR regulator
MTIGEVLAVLKPEFADITVSKLRFLEGAGLVSPERTPAGYRKFSEDDVGRLRFVLRAQRDQYLPLRVIRQRLADLEASGGLHGRDAGGDHTPAPAASTANSTAPAPWAPPAAGPDPATLVQAVDADAPADAPAGPAPATSGAPAQLTRDELCKAAGRDPADLAALEAFGLISARGSGERGAWYSPDDLLVLRLAGELAVFGLEPRHLRMYKTFAEREAALFGQVAAPLLRQRNPESHEQARNTVERLSQLCGQLHGAVLRGLIGGPVEPPR